MGNITSLYGKTTGKIGSIVFATSGGETIAREYNPHVANPSTTAQVNQRARLKLMSQLSASLASVIVMTKQGLVSRRNKFVKKNMESCYAEGGIAQISYENVQLTEGSIGLPQIVGGKINNPQGEVDPWGWGFATSPAANIARVVFSLFEKTDENNLALLESAIVERGNYTTVGGVSIVPMGWSTAFIFEPSIPGEDIAGKELVIYAYGMVDTSEAATARYGNMNLQNGSDIANLVANRTISYEDYQFSRTRGATIGTNGAPITPTEEGYARVFVTALGTGGSVTGSGSFEIGTQVTVRATAASGYQFSRWIYNGTNTTASTNADYTFTLEGQTDLVAVFEAQGGGGGL